MNFQQMKRVACDQAVARRRLFAQQRSGSSNPLTSPDVGPATASLLPATAGRDEEEEEDPTELEAPNTNNVAQPVSEMVAIAVRNITAGIPVAGSLSSPAGAGGASPQPQHSPSLRDRINLVVRLQEHFAKENTSKAYKRTIFEYFEYADYRRIHVPEARRYLVCHDNIAEFVLYQAFRDKRPKDKAYKENLAQKHGFAYFDPDDFNAIKSTLNNASMTGSTIVEPKDGLGTSHISQVRASLRKLHRQQVAEQTNNTSWDLVWSADLELIAKMVDSRKARQDKANHKEKAHAATSPYEVVNKITSLEDWFFRRGIHAPSRTVFASLRNRYFYLRTHTSLLRGESLIMEELSDLFGVQIHTPRDPHEMEIFMSSVATGKTNRAGKAIFGRSCRHRNVNMCPYGAIGFWFLYRFHVTKEMDPPPDFLENAAWFDIKVRLACVTCSTQRLEHAQRNVIVRDHCPHTRSLAVPCW